jgi:hypothetical protein
MSNGFSDLFGSAQPANAAEAEDLFTALFKERTEVSENPRARIGNNTPGIGPNPSPGTSFAAELYAVADDIRQIYTDFGMRPYRVFSVVYACDAGDGRGPMRLISELEFLPTPFVDMRPLRSEIKPAGEVTRGLIAISQISPRYTERQISSAILDRPLTHNETAFVEVRVDARDGTTIRRRILIVDVPWRNPDNFGWEVTGMIQDEARNVDGTYAEVSLYRGSQ